uniref:Inactive disease resistance protein RPS4 n=1 Tax=Noccaea caerulescens TaxID=107243 RepID=A0A1J3CIZ3_NOCCA
MLPKTMEQLSRLKYMDLHTCCKLKALPALTQVETLILSDCVNLRSLLEFPVTLEDQGRYRLIVLELGNCNKVESLSDQLNHFTDLIDFETVPASIKELSSLTTLNLSDCKRLKSLGELPLSIECLYAHGCCVLERFPLFLETDLITQFPTIATSGEVSSKGDSLQESETPNSYVNVDAIRRRRLPISMPWIKPSLVLLGSVTWFMLFYIGGMAHGRRRSQPNFRST